MVIFAVFALEDLTAIAMSAGTTATALVLGKVAYTLGYLGTILTLAWRPAWTLAPFAVTLVGGLFLQQEAAALLVGAIILALASYAVTTVPLSIMVVSSLAWEIGWRVLHDAVDDRLLWPVPIMILILIPGRAIRILVQRHQRERAAAAAWDDAARAREQALVEENKRQRLVVSRELHDVVAHELTRIAMQSSVGQLSDKPDVHREALTAISASSRTAMAEMRRLVRLLNDGTGAGPSAPPGGGIGSLELSAELQRVVSYLADLGFHPDWSIDGDSTRIPPGLLPTGVTILREAATNIVKHSSPGGRCRLSVTVEEDNVVVEVRNEISAGLLDLPESGVGLAGLRARVSDLNGTFTSTQEGGWWTVRASMPFSDTGESSGAAG
ncbi:MAG: histidine kinase [Propionibacteriales bacterium]|nr:histidine kinase [Propionibacteriales bacterium]